MNQVKPLEITDDEFSSLVLGAQGIAVVDFWAPWCGPCLTMAPVLEAFALENAGRVRVFKLDVDQNPKTAEKYDIQSIPTLVFFKDGVLADIHVGTLSAESLRQRLAALTED